MEFLSKMKAKAIGNLEAIEKVFEMIEHFLESKLGLKKSRKVTVGILTSLVVIFGSIDINTEALIAGGIVLVVLISKDKIIKMLKQSEETEVVDVAKDDKAADSSKSEEKDK